MRVIKPRTAPFTATADTQMDKSIIRYTYQVDKVAAGGFVIKVVDIGLVAPNIS